MVTKLANSHLKELKILGIQRGNNLEKATSRSLDGAFQA
jgi:hypothetical protein